jgi:hypothetical protein
LVTPHGLVERLVAFEALRVGFGTW